MGECVSSVYFLIESHASAAVCASHSARGMTSFRLVTRCPEPNQSVKRLESGPARGLLFSYPFLRREGSLCLITSSTAKTALG